MPIFSIITICYNSEKTIERTIKSVLAQSYKDYEYIIVDGASKDGTLDIVKRYELLFEGRLKWKSESDKGIYNAMNKGIERSTGDIIGIVNSDDWLESDALDIVAKSFEENEHNTNALYCGGIVFHLDNGEQRFLNADKEVFLKNSRNYVLAGIRHPATFVPKQVYNNVGLFDETIKIAADADFILRCKNKGVNIITINSYLSNMADGGLSNRRGIYRIGKNDRRIILKKNEVTGIQYCYQMTYWILKYKFKLLLIRLSLFRIS